MSHHIEKLEKPHIEVLRSKIGITVGQVPHPTAQELVDKLNEIIDFLNTLPAHKES